MEKAKELHFVSIKHVYNTGGNAIARGKAAVLQSGSYFTDDRYVVERLPEALYQTFGIRLGEPYEKIDGVVVFGRTPKEAAQMMAAYLDGETKRTEEKLKRLAKMKKEVLG